MAVPSTGQLSLFGIAMEMVHADYDEPSPVPSNPNPTSRSDHKLYDSPGGEDSKDFYSPHATIARNPTSPAPNKDATQSEYSSQLYAANTNTINDISLTGMSGASQDPVPSTIGGGAGTFRTTMGHYNPNFPVSLTHKSPDYTVTKLNSALYGDGSTEFGGMSTHPAPLITATIMYTMFIGDSETPTNSDQHGFIGLVFGYNPSVFEGGTLVSVSGPTKSDFAGSPPLPAPSAEPANFEGIPFYHPQPNTVNSNYPALNYPSTAGDVAMSNFYGYDHDFVAPLPEGINMSTTALFTGNQGTSLQTYNVDFSSPTHLGASVVGHPSTSIYYVIAYKNGSSPNNRFRGDVQFTRFEISGPPSPSVLEFTSPNPFLPTSKTSLSSPPSPTPLNINPLTPQTNAQTVVSNYASKLTTTVPSSPGTTSGRWNYRASGGTPSGGTGVTDPTGYYYAETSGPPVRVNQWFVLAAPTSRTGAQISSDEMTFKFYANGSNIGSCFVGLWVDYPNTGD